MLNTAFSPWPSFSQTEIEASTRVLASGKVNYWTGQECREFEREFAKFAGTQKCVALSNGTLALDAIWAALGIGAGDEVIVTPSSWLASGSSGRSAISPVKTRAARAPARRAMTMS